MADTKTSALTAQTTVDPDDLLYAVDVSDTTMAASGTSKKATREALQTFAAGTLTTDKKLLDLSATWNAAGVTFTGFKLNVTDTASASGSLVADWQIGGTTEVALTKGGNFGIGTAAPSAKFVVSTSAAAISRFISTNASGGYLTLVNTSTEIGYFGTAAPLLSGAATDTAIRANNALVLTSGGAYERARFTTTSAVFNEPGADYDFRIEGDTDANLFFVDASTDRVGIGTNAPVDKFTVVGSNEYSLGGWFQTNSTQTAAGDHPVVVLSNTNSATNNNGVAFRFVGRDTSATNRSIGQIGGVFTARTASSVTGSLYVAVVGASGFQESVRFDNSYSVLVGGTTSPTTGTKCLSIFSGTAPTATAADSITVYSSDLSAGNTMLSVYTEGTSVSDSTDNAVTKKIAVRINGTVYYLLADTDNS